MTTRSAPTGPIDRRPSSRPFPFLRQALTLFVGMYLGGRMGTFVRDGEGTRPTKFDRANVGPPGHLFDPIKVPSLCPRKKRRRVVDMTLINNELSSLELRLNELWNAVDVFLVGESTVPFKPGATDKPLHLADRWKDFERFHSKMVRYEIPPEVGRGTGARVDLEDFRPNFKVQNAQRDDLWRHLKEEINLRDDDLIMKADLDEIPRPDAVERLACVPPGTWLETPICLATKDSFYYYNYRCHIKNEWKDSPRILRHGENYHLPYYAAPCQRHVVNASIHCSSCFGSLDDYHVKSLSNSEPIRRPELQTNNASILERVRSCKDFWLRDNLDETMELRPSVDIGSIPLIVAKHPERWPHLMGEGPLYDGPMIPNKHAVGADKAAKLMTKTRTTEGSGIRVPVCSTAENTCVRPRFPRPETVPCPAQDSLQISPTGAYILPESYVYRFDRHLADAILDIVSSGSLLELGAGLGCYTHYFRESKRLSKVEGYEGAANVRERSGGLVAHADLSEKHDFGDFDWVASLEVAEHIPAEFESTFVANVMAPRPRGIVLSWALPDQPGSGHVNGRSNDYVASLMRTRGYGLDGGRTRSLRSAARLGWFKETAMVFVRIATDGR